MYTKDFGKKAEWNTNTNYMNPYKLQALPIFVLQI